MNKTKFAIVYGMPSILVATLATRLEAQGVDLLILDFDQKNLDNVRKKNNSNVLTKFLDVNSSLDNTIDAVIDHIGDREVDYLILNPCQLTPIKKLLDVNYTDWKVSALTNLDFPVFLTRKLLLRLNQQSRVLFLFNEMAFVPVAGLSAYSASQTSLRMVSNILSMESNGALFASLMLGAVNTEFLTQLGSADSRHLPSSSYFRELHESHNVVSPESAANFISWLLVDIDGDTFKDEQWDCSVENDNYSV